MIEPDLRGVPGQEDMMDLIEIPCHWCQEPCSPDFLVRCERDQCDHPEGEAVYCSRSCRNADHA